jgi:hypothetical protein
MKNLKLSIAVDSLFIFISCFFLAYAVIRYSGTSFAPSLIFSVLISLVLGFLFLLYIIIKNDKSSVKLNEENSLLLLKTELCFMDKQDLLELFYNFYKQSKIKAEIQKDYIVLPELKCQIFFNFTYEKTDTTKIIECYKQTIKGYKTVVLGIDFTPDAIALVNDLSLRIKLFDIKSVYLALKSQELLPKTTIQKKVNKVSFIDKMKGVFIKSNGKKALGIGAIILLSARFSFYPIYYIIFGSLMVIFSIVLRFWGKKETRPFDTKKPSLSF